MRKIMRMAAAIAVLVLPAATAASAHDHGYHRWHPYVIEKACDENFEHCKVRLDYAPGQHAGLAGPGSYWYQYPHQHHRHWKGHSRHMAWCLGRYRTYDPHSNTFIGKGHRLFQCNSPYDWH